MIDEPDSFTVVDFAGVNDYAGRKVRIQCVCGAEYAVTESSPCANCGRNVPRAVSVDGGPWKTYLEFRIEGVKQMLEPRMLERVPAEHREIFSGQMKLELRKLEDGSWKAEARKRIESYRRMIEGWGTMQQDDPEQKIASLERILAPGALDQFGSAEERDSTRKRIEEKIQSLRDGTWKKQMEEMIEGMKRSVKRLTEELEAAGERVEG